MERYRLVYFVRTKQNRIKRTNDTVLWLAKRSSVRIPTLRDMRRMGRTSEPFDNAKQIELSNKPPTSEGYALYLISRYEPWVNRQERNGD